MAVAQVSVTTSDKVSCLKGAFSRSRTLTVLGCRILEVVCLVRGGRISLHVYNGNCKHEEFSVIGINKTRNLHKSAKLHTLSAQEVLS
jgi:hypothetical protein